MAYLRWKNIWNFSQRQSLGRLRTSGCAKSSWQLLSDARRCVAALLKAVLACRCGRPESVCERFVSGPWRKLSMDTPQDKLIAPPAQSAARIEA
jgi:hypothetical protein